MAPSCSSQFRLENFELAHSLGVRNCLERVYRDVLLDLFAVTIRFGLLPEGAQCVQDTQQHDDYISCEMSAARPRAPESS